MSERAFVAVLASLSQTCNFDTREDAKIYMTSFSQMLQRHGTSLLLSEELSSWLPDVFEDFLPFVSIGLRFCVGEDDRPLRL